MSAFQPSALQKFSKFIDDRTVKRVESLLMKNNWAGKRPAQQCRMVRR
jgi:hypothetical protein